MRLGFHAAATGGKHGNKMPLTDLNLLPVYNHGNCPDLLAGLYEPLLAQAVRYDRTTYTFTARAGSRNPKQFCRRHLLVIDFTPRGKQTR